MFEDGPSLGGKLWGLRGNGDKEPGLWDGDRVCSPPLLSASHFSRGQALGTNEGRNKLVTSRLISQETYSVLAKNR